jgi:cytochrome P450
MDAIKASELARPQFKANPHPFYARMRAQSPVFTISAPFYKRAWLVTRYDDAVTFLKHERFLKDPLEGKSREVLPKPIIADRHAGAHASLLVSI